MSFSAFLQSTLSRISGTGQGTPTEAYQANTAKLPTRLWDVFSRTFDLGVTAFGGPPVHFQILHRRFVEGAGGTPWIDEQTYQEIFAVCQALPGPASTKMLFSIAQIRAGLLPALLAFTVWSLPGAVAMYGLALGVQRVDTVLPDPVYALLSGLNAAVVGVIALAAVQLARKAITDKLTRLLVFFGGGAGLCYNALWYFPVLVVIAGVVTVAWDCWFRGWVRRFMQRRRSNRPSIELEHNAETGLADTSATPTGALDSVDSEGLQRRQAAGRSSTDGRSESRVRTTSSQRDTEANSRTTSEAPILQSAPQRALGHGIPIKIGLGSTSLFIAVFVTVMVLRGVLRAPPMLFALFNNMFLAGTIIFGGGPVVIPLLRQYVVEPGWVSPRDFLLGLAIIQALPGPNFNFAVYLGALAALSGSSDRSVGTTLPGALLAFFGIFTPGLWLSVGFQSVWRALRKRPEIVSVLRGVNAAAVGFVFTAVYRLWEIGFLTKEVSRGVSLGLEPWWLFVASAAFTAVEWFSVPPPVAILTGGVAGIAWWGVVRS